MATQEILTSKNEQDKEEVAFYLRSFKNLFKICVDNIFIEDVREC